MINKMTFTPARVTIFVRKHALLLYFGGAFLISWVFWFVEPSLRVADGMTAGLFIQFGTYGPILAAMLVAALSNPERIPAPLGLRLLAGGLVLALATYINWPAVTNLLSTSDSLLHWSLLAVSILLPAWIFFNAHSGLRGVQELLQSLTRWRTNPLWFLVAIFLMLFLSLTGVLFTSLLTGQTLASLLIMVLLHTAVNVTSSIIAPAVGMFITTTVAVVLMVVFNRMYKKIPAD